MNSWNRMIAGLVLLVSGNLDLSAQTEDLDHLAELFSTEKKVRISAEAEAVMALIRVGDIAQANVKLSELPDTEREPIFQWARKTLAPLPPGSAPSDEAFNVAEWIMESTDSAPADISKAIQTMLSVKTLRKDLDQKKQSWHPLEFRAMAHRILTANRMNPHLNNMNSAYAANTENIDELNVLKALMKRKSMFKENLLPFELRLLELGQRDMVNIPGALKEMRNKGRAEEAAEFWLQYPGTGADMLDQRVSLIKALNKQGTPRAFALVEKLVTYQPDNIHHAPSKEGHHGLYYAFYHVALDDAMRRNNLQELEHIFGKIIRDSSRGYLDQRFLCSRLIPALRDAEQKEDYRELLAPMIREAYTSNQNNIAYVLAMAVLLHAEQNAADLLELTQKYYLYMNEGERAHLVRQIQQTVTKPDDKQAFVETMRNLPFPEEVGDAHFQCLATFGHFQLFADMREYATSLEPRLSDDQQYRVCRMMMTKYTSAGAWEEVLKLSDTFYAFDEKEKGKAKPNFEVKQHVQIAVATSKLGDPNEAADVFLKRFDEQLRHSNFSFRDVQLLHQIPGFASKLKAYIQKHNRHAESRGRYQFDKGISLLAKLLDPGNSNERLVKMIQQIGDAELLIEVIRYQWEYGHRYHYKPDPRRHAKLMALVLEHLPKEELTALHELRGSKLLRRTVPQHELLFKLEQEICYAEAHQGYLGPHYLRYLERLGKMAHAMDLVEPYRPKKKKK